MLIFVPLVLFWLLGACSVHCGTVSTAASVDPLLNSLRSLEQKGTQAALICNATSKYAAAASDTSVGSSVVLLYDGARVLAWCDTPALFHNDYEGLDCEVAKPTCQRCNADLWQGDDNAPGRHDYYLSKDAPEPKRGTKEWDAWAKGRNFPMWAFQNYCETKLSLNVRADCPWHDNLRKSDPPPAHLADPCKKQGTPDTIKVFSNGFGPHSNKRKRGWF